MLHLYLPILQPPLTILLLLTASSFLLHLLVLLGSTSNASVLRSLCFLRFYDVSWEKGFMDTPGLSNFFQVGLWNYYEGFEDRVLVCEEPQEFWWFNPMEEIVEKLFSGAGDLIPSPRHWSPILSIFTSFFSALFSTTPAAISTALYCSYRNFFEDHEEIQINGVLGRNMFIVMWAASIITIESSAVRVMCGCWNPERIRGGRGGELLKIVRRIHVPRTDPVRVE
ncbi:hypothetical protein B9Z19DRAFT_1119170 [Tuber borchii]|uniref:Uncharacterized protein n=1 Tax=Tuber borchii TaxID=42251 RepID=A0A2T7A6V4_TUBBO|nr:hypothetical protein B9Z19DRAFT_1119170 [Tuber borchii]